MSFPRLKPVVFRIGLLFLFFLTKGEVYSQDYNLMWYISTEQQDEEAEIDAVLKQVKKRNAAVPFLESPYCLNDLQQNEVEGFIIRRQLDRFSENGVFAVEDTSAIDKKIFDKLLGHQFFLRVKIFSNLDQKTITFKLFKTIPGRSIGDDKVVMPQLDLLNAKIESAKFSARASSEEIKAKISNAIKRLFPELNIPPVARIRINDKEDEVYYHVHGKAFKLDGTASTDEDTDRKNLQYKWRQIALDGSKNVIDTNFIQLDEQADTAYYVFPRTGTYQFGLKVYDGMVDSKEDTLTVINFSQPKTSLDKPRLRRHKKISFFQFLNPKNRSQKIEDKIAVRIQSDVSLDYRLNYFEAKRRVPPSIRILKEQKTRNSYQLEFNGKLKYQENYRYGIYGRAGNVYTDTSYYSLEHSKFVFYRLSLGTEYFAGPEILCVEPLNGPLWIVFPTSILGRIYFLHNSGVSLSMDAGLLIFWRQSLADRLAGGFGLGKIALTLTAEDLKGQRSLYFALQVIGGSATNEMGDKVVRRHYGCVGGLSILENRINVDVINLYYNFNEKCFSLSGGIRFNIYNLSSRKKTHNL